MPQDRVVALARPEPRVVRVPTSAHAVQVQPPTRFRARFPFVGFVDFQGLPIDVENRVGDVRRGTDKDGHAWATKMHFHYGELRHGPDGRVFTGKDGDKLDVYLGPLADSSLVVVVHQNDPVSGRFDEDKVMLGFATAPEAVAAYRQQYDRPGFYGGHESMTIGEFRRWVSNRKNAGKAVRAAG